jgi:phosphatidylethanolamine/phosphatidyl-N-methylethanolamine N-methyltransferase
VSSSYLNNEYNQLCISARGGVLQKKMHSLIESEHKKQHFDSVLEVGAHYGEHLESVKHSWSKYIMVDINPIPEEVRNKLPNGVEFFLADAANLPFENATFDRVIVTCVLHHVDNVSQVLAELRRVVKAHGTISILIPCDPGISYRLFKEMTTGFISRRVGAYDKMKLFHALEHKNHFSSITVQILEKFKNDSIRFKFLPFYFKSWNLNLVATVQIIKS